MPAILLLALLAELAPMPRPHADLTGYRRVDQLERLAAPPADDGTAPAPGFLGVDVAGDGTVRAVAPDSPAAKAGLQAGDRLTAVDGVSVRADAKDRLRGLTAGTAVKLAITSGGAAREASVTPEPVSKPLTGQAARRALVGIQSGEARDRGGVDVTNVTPGGPADKAGVKVGDVVLKIAGTPIDEKTGIREVLELRSPGDAVKIALRRGQDELEVVATLGAAAGPQPRAIGWDDRLPTAWKKPAYKLVVVGIDYPDVKHNPKITNDDWQKAMFSVGEYDGKSATGQKTYGSVADYYKEISYGKLKVEGTFAGWVEVSKKRADYSTGSGTSLREKTKLLTEALDVLSKRDGAESLKQYDGVFFLYAGGRVNTTRGGLYWPHRASLLHEGKRWPYFIVQEGGPRMTDISVFCHEFGHMLGLPDLYARPEVPGMEGVGPWCAMSQQEGNGRPQHFSAWSKEQLKWVEPAVIDPRVRQKVVLAPIGTSPTECVKVLVRPDGSEYFLLENRQKTGFDSSLPAAGLLIWRVTPGGTTQKVFLEESHGVGGPAGPRLFPNDVPYPSRANTQFTPATTPSSKSVLGGGYDVYVTEIRRLPDGRVSFAVGYEFQ